jgi:hypothetical protein
MPRKDAVSHIIAQGKQDAPLRLLTPQPGDTADAAVSADPRQYQAFTTGMKPPRLTIRCSSQPSRSPPYMALLDVVFDERFGGAASLIFTHMVVTITGKNLAGVVAAICRHKATTITEFAAQAFDAPDSDVPVIDGIEVEAGHNNE